MDRINFGQPFKPNKNPSKHNFASIIGSGQQKDKFFVFEQFGLYKYIPYSLHTFIQFA
jgi:hypothetical protein